MIKRILPIVLCLLLLGSTALAEEVSEMPAVSTEITEATEAPAAPVPEEEAPAMNGTMPERGMGRGSFGGEMGNPPQGGNMPSMSEGEMPQEGQNPFQGEMPQGGMSEGFRGEMNVEESATAEPEANEMPQTAAEFIKEYQTPVISVVLLILAFFFVIFYKRKNY